MMLKLKILYVRQNRVYIFDTTMRDGEQSPGASMNLEEKIQISRVFDELG
jgi:2-isopropylmalate synthase